MEIHSTTTENVPAPELATTPESIADSPRRSRKRSIIIFTVVTLVNVGLLALLLTQLLTPRSDAPNTSSGLGDMSSPLLGNAAPDFTLPTLNGQTANIHLANLKGKVVVLNFWAASCVPCNDEAPFLQQVWQQQLHSKGIVLLGIDGPENKTDALNFLQKYHITYPNVKDTIYGETASKYGTTGNPETFFIDKDGRVVARWLGPLDQHSLQNELAKAHVTL